MGTDATTTPTSDATTTPTISLATINIENINSNILHLQQLLQTNDIVCMQEHWLHRFEAKRMQELLPDYQFSIKCYDDNHPVDNLYRPPRGQAGVATVWKAHLNHCIEEAPDGSTRVIVNHLHTSTGMITIINSYLPSEGSHDQDANYSSVLDEVYEITRKYRSNSTIVWAGDLNGSLQRCQPSSNDKLLKAFCMEMGFKSLITKQDTPTFHHFNRISTSQIDHIMSLTSQADLVKSIKVDIRNPTNTSSHDAVIAILEATPKKSPKTKDITFVKGKPNWSKVDITAYKEMTQERLSNFIANDGLVLPNEVTVPCINNILTSSAEACGAATKKKQCKRKSKMPWSPSFKPMVRHIKDVMWRLKQAKRQPGHAFMDDLSLDAEDLQPNVGTIQLLEDEYHTAKKALRSAQRQLAATQRKKLHEEIMDAHEGDRDTFYKLVKRQRGTGSKPLATIDFGEDKDQLDGWATYFEDLATPVDNPKFDSGYKQSRELMFHLLQQQEATQPHVIETVDESVMVKHVKALKSRKAADLYGVTAEHLKYASDAIYPLLTSITNRNLTEQKLPSHFKIGKVVPVLKKGKPATDPNSHRRITVSSMIGKVAEKEMAVRTKPTLKNIHSKLQFGFTEKCSSSNCAFIITEALAEAKDAGHPLYITMMDARKAFDVVWHESTLVQLHNEGITGPLWRTYVDMYKDVESIICVNGELSRTISEGQGIRQGAETSTEIFKTRANPVIRATADIPDTLRIGTTKVGAPTCADDICMLSRSHLGAQTALLIAQNDANKERYEFSASKTKVLLYNNRPKTDLLTMKETSPLLLNDQPLEYTSQETHLGLQRKDDGKASATVKARIQTGRRMGFSLMGAGMYGLNGVNPKVSTAMINTYVMPAVMHGLETLRLTPSDYKEMATYHQKLLRNIMHLPQATALPALYLMTGSLPLEAIHHRNTLTFFVNMLHRKESVEREVIIRQLAMKNMDSNSWVILVRELLYKYQLPSAFHLTDNPPRKAAWKKRVKRAINQHWYSKLKKEAAEKNTLKYLNTDACEPGKVHPVWICGSDPLDVTKAATKARMLVQRYGIASNHSAGRNKSDTCPLCHTDPETMPHFLLNCPVLEKARRPKLKKIVELLHQHNVQVTSEAEVTQAILDCSKFWWIPEPARYHIETLTRRLCYDLHRERSCIIGSERSEIH